MIGNAIRCRYAVGEKIITGYTPVDMWPIFGIETGSNGSTNVVVPYTAEMDAREFGERSRLLRGILKEQLRPENIAAGLAEMAGAYQQADAQPYTIEQIVPVIRQRNPHVGDGAPYTYGLSYPGKIRFPAEIEPFINSVTVSVSSCSFPLMIVACEYRGIIRMMVTQLFDSDEVAKMILREIEAVIPGTAFIDYGIRHYDRLDLETLEHTAQESHTT